MAGSQKRKGAKHGRKTVRTVTASEPAAPKSAVTTSKKKPRGKPFAKGKSGNPNGRPLGSKHKLSEIFLTAMVEDFAEFGIAAIVAARLEDPVAYIKTVARVIAKVDVDAIDAANVTIQIVRFGDAASA